MEGKQSRIDRWLLDDSLKECRFYTWKIEQIDEHLESYIREHFQKEYQLLMELPVVKH